MNETVNGVLTSRLAWSSSFTSRLAERARAHRRKLELVLASALYLGFACYLTWPVITDLGHSIYGGSGDPFGTMAFYRELVDHHHNPFLPGTISQFSGPEGQAIPWARDLASAPGTLALYLLTMLFGAIPAYGLYTLAGYTLTGIVTFLFARRLTGNTWAALIAGWAFAFYPFAAINGQGHLDNIQGWVLVISVWRMLELLWRPSRRNGVLAGLTVALSMWWSPYFILFGGVAYVAVTATALFFSWRERNLRETLLPQLIAASIVVVFVAYLGVLSHVETAEGTGVRTHSARELNVYGARPFEYLLPDAQSPLFGGDTRPYLETHLYGSGPVEATLYVGITVMLLALVAFAAFVRRKLTPRLGRAVLALWLIAVAAVITSMPPEIQIFGVLVPFPSHFISQVTTTWRVYSRFVMLAMLALSVLAAIGLDAIARGRSSWAKIAVTSLASIAVPLDLWAPQGGHVTKISTPGIYQTLARQPMGLVAEYPLTSPSNGGYNDIFYQNTYNKPMINGYLEDSFQELRAFSLSYLANPSTAPDLATLGVRYVVVETAQSSPVGGWAPAGTPGAGFRLIAQEPYADLYVVTARPESSALPTAGAGFVAVEATKTSSITALEQPSGTIELTGSCAPCDGVLAIALTPYRQAREVTVSDDHGHALGHASLTGPTTMKIPLRFARRTTLRLTATPGPQPVNEAPESLKVSVLMTHLEFIDAGGASGLAPVRKPGER